jgi:Methyltransferase FkbM domain
VETKKIKLININKVLAKHFPPGGPDFLSVDTEGLDLDILRSLDFSRFRPKVVCAETAEATDGTVDQEILALMATHDYSVRGGSFINTVFVDNKRLKEIAAIESHPASAASASSAQRGVGSKPAPTAAPAASAP